MDKAARNSREEQASPSKIRWYIGMTIRDPEGLEGYRRRLIEQLTKQN